MPSVVEYERREPVQPGSSSWTPWTWVPVLYFLQSLPYVLVTVLAPLALQKMGVAKLVFLPWLGVAALPWTLKLLWAPLIDLSAKKRTWVLILQPVLTVLTLAVAAAFALGAGGFAWILVLLAAVAIASSTHDIAADGYYLLALRQTEQARFVGVLTTAGRLAKLYCQFVLLYLVGVLIDNAHYSPAMGWAVATAGLAVTYAVGAAIDFVVLKDVEPPLAGSTGVMPHVQRTAAVVFAGLLLYFLLAAVIRLVGHYEGPELGVPAAWTQTPTALSVWKWIAVGTALTIVPAWWVAAKLLHGSAIGQAISTYVRQPRFGSILFFIITYRIGEAMLSSMSYLFLQDPAANGGLGLDPKALASVTGIAGLVGIIIGGLLGGWFVSRVGLRRSFWPLAIIMHTPNLLFVYAAFARPPLWQIYPIMFVDQFGYGFGFAAYFVYLMRVAQRRPEFRTTHYAIGTGLGALIVSTIAPALSAIIQSRFGYTGFFISCCLATVPGMIALFLIPLDETPLNETPLVETPLDEPAAAESGK